MAGCVRTAHRLHEYSTAARNHVKSLARIPLYCRYRCTNIDNHTVGKDHQPSELSLPNLQAKVSAEPRFSELSGERPFVHNMCRAKSFFCEVLEMESAAGDNESGAFSDRVQ
jgi:ferritin-like protein